MVLHIDICNGVHCDLDTVFDWIYKGSLGEDKFKELSSAYWDENLYFINDVNSNLREKIPEKIVKKNFKPKVRQDYDYWKNGV